MTNTVTFYRTRTINIDRIIEKIEEKIRDRKINWSHQRLANTIKFILRESDLDQTYFYSRLILQLSIIDFIMEKCNIKTERMLRIISRADIKELIEFEWRYMYKELIPEVRDMFTRRK